MSELFQFKIYCTTDNQFEYIWGTSPPTICPVNGGHSVDTTTVTIENTIQATTITDSDSPIELNRYSVIADSTSGNIILNLLSVNRFPTAEYVIYKSSGNNTVTLSPSGSDLIDGNASLNITSGDTSTVITSNGTTGWDLLTNNDSLQQYEITFEAAGFAAQTADQGDLLVDDGSRLGRLILGTNDQVLTVDTSERLGLKWTTASRRFDAYYDPVSETVVGNSWTDVPLNIERAKTSDFTHTVNAAQVTINTTDNYLIQARVTNYTTNSNSRTNTQMRLVLDSGGGFNQISGSIASMYHRNLSQGQNSGFVTLILPLNSGDILKIQSIIISGSATISMLSEGAGLTITKV